MLTSSYHVDSIEEAFHLTLELELFFKEIFIHLQSQEVVYKCEGFEH